MDVLDLPRVKSPPKSVWETTALHDQFKHAAHTVQNETSRCFISPDSSSLSAAESLQCVQETQQAQRRFKRNATNTPATLPCQSAEVVGGEGPKPPVRGLWACPLCATSANNKGSAEQQQKTGERQKRCIRMRAGNALLHGGLHTELDTTMPTNMAVMGSLPL